MSAPLFERFGGKKFAHGVHPPTLKEDTESMSIHQFPFAPSLMVPLSQHVGNPAVPVVGEGVEVVRGQCIAKADGFLSVPIHAPASGIVRRIGLGPSISGEMVPAFFLEPFPGSTQEITAGRGCDLERASPAEIVAAIQQAGVVGLGGAGFPTHAKLSIPAGKSVDTVVVNGAECEPYLTTDHRIMLEHAEELMLGIRFVLKATGAERAIVAIEANKRDAAEVVRRAIPTGMPVAVEVLPVKYPQGAEKMLITTLTGREVPSGGLPIDAHAICINVGTATQLGILLPRGTGLQERVITVSGPGVKRKGNYRIPIGTPLRFILDVVGTEQDVTSVVMGGPMMGSAASSLDLVITKGSTGVIALTERETGVMAARSEYPCIRCAYCVDACPLFLNPSQLGMLAGQERYQEMSDEYHLMDCFECGCCTYVCPSHIPLVQKFRVAKAFIRKAGVSQ